MSPTFGIVANEPSGDFLGAALMRELRARRPDARFVGVAGPRMQEVGCETLVAMERLSVMGLTEVLAELPALLRIRGDLRRELQGRRPVAFIGIDAPDFNIGLERRLRSAGIPTAHLVSPTVWAWRPGRVRQIRRSVDLMLSIYPFEEDFLRTHGVPVRYVGHPMADEIPMTVDRAAARSALGLRSVGPVVAILPGSRRAEVERLGPPFLQTANWCLERRGDLQFVIPVVNAGLREMLEASIDELTPDLPIRLVDGRSREVIAASDLVLTASGTATLEALLLKRPMVVAYRVHPLTYQLVKRLRLVKVPHIAMANLLAGEALAPEFIQTRCRVKWLGPALLAFLAAPDRIAAVQRRYAEIHASLRHNAAAEAAEAVLGLVAGRAS